MTGFEQQLEEFRQEFARMGRLLDGRPGVVELSAVRRWMDARRAALAPMLAAMLADRVLLEGASWQQLADELDATHPALIKTVADHGPREYVAVRPGDEGTDLLRVPVPGPGFPALRAELRRLTDSGWRVAPALLAVDADTVDARELWLRLAPS